MGAVRALMSHWIRQPQTRRMSLPVQAPARKLRPQAASRSTVHSDTSSQRDDEDKSGMIELAELPSSSLSLAAQSPAARAALSSSSSSSLRSRGASDVAQPDAAGPGLHVPLFGVQVPVRCTCRDSVSHVDMPLFAGRGPSSQGIDMVRRGAISTSIASP